MAFANKLFAKKTWILIGITIVLISIGAALFMYWNMGQPDKASTSDDASKSQYRVLSEKIQAEDGDVSLKQVTDGYGSTYDDAMVALQKSDVTKWDQAAVDKAHFCLLYASKVGAHSQVEAVYYWIFAAQKSGVNVDANANGLTQQDRDRLLNEAQGETPVSLIQKGSTYA